MMDEHNEARAKIALRSLSANECQAAVHAEDVGREGHVAAITRIVVERAAGTKEGRCWDEGEILVRLVARELGVAPKATLHEILTARTDGHGSLPDGYVVQAQHFVRYPVAVVRGWHKGLIGEGIEELKAGGHLGCIVLGWNIAERLRKIRRSPGIC